MTLWQCTSHFFIFEIGSNESVEFDQKIIRKYYRQYMGFINDKNEEVVSIYLFNEAQHEFAKWRDKYILGAGEFFEKNTRSYKVNLTKGEIKYRK